MDDLEATTLRATFTAKTAAEMMRVANIVNHRNKDFWEGYPPECLLIQYVKGELLSDGTLFCVAELGVCPGPDAMALAIPLSDGGIMRKAFPSVRYGAPVDFAELGLVLVRPTQPIP